MPDKKRFLKNMAYASMVADGIDPIAAQQYLNGEYKEGIKTDTEASKRNAKAAAATLGVIGATAAAPAVFPVLMNPVTAKTAVGAGTATLLDAYGVTSGIKGLSGAFDKARYGSFKWRDVPELGLNLTTLIPGSSVLTTPKNMATAARTANNIYQKGKLAIDTAKGTKHLNTNKFVSEIRIGKGNYSDTFLDDATTIAESIMNPGKMSLEAKTGVERMKLAFKSDWMKARLRNEGYTDREIEQYITDRLAGLNLSKTSVAENLSAIRSLEGRTNGAIVINPRAEVGYGQNSNALGIEPFDQQFIQITRGANVKDVMSHEIGGHGTENFNLAFTKSGNPIYSDVKLTDLGKEYAKNTGLGESYFLAPNELRSRFIVTAQDMSEQGLNPNNYSDFVDFIVKSQNAPISTNTGQTAKFYDFRTLWPAFSKAKGVIPIIGIGVSALKESQKETL